ncbi:hypothetical protein [Rudanella lutea]|uniref:hypothetical protein n=1 Tax=Rudanella lutea TaxID=451374 RepID=UPI00039E3C6A|nr:hypothetical protein [Rudanella lutea]
MNQVLAIHNANTYHLQSEQNLRNCLETVTDMNAFMARHALPSFQVGTMIQPITPSVLQAIEHRVAESLENFLP